MVLRVGLYGLWDQEQCVQLLGLDGITGLEAVTDEIRFDLATFFLPLYCGLYLLGLYMVSKYKIDRERHNHNLKQLADRVRLEKDSEPRSETWGQSKVSE